jgi:Leucine-rich repeat (LRR) protein
MSAGPIDPSSPRIAAENQWLAAHGFSTPSDSASYSLVRDFFKNCPLKTPQEWKGKGLSFAGGKVHIVERGGETADKIALVLKRTLDLASRPEKFELLTAIDSMRKGLGVPVEPPKDIVVLKETSLDPDEVPVTKEIELPPFLCAQSPFLSACLGTTAFYEGQVDAEGKGITTEITLPKGITISQFELFLEWAQSFPDIPPKQLNYSDLFPFFILADWVLGSEAINVFLDKWMGSPDRAQQRSDLSLILEASIGTQKLDPFDSAVISKMVNAYIRSSLAEGQRMEQIYADLSSMAGADLFKIVPFQLNLADTSITQEDLPFLDKLCPNLESLDVSKTNLTQIPQEGYWKNLKVFKAKEARQLAGISGLDGLLQLKEVDISWTQVTAAPTGCPALERFIASDARNFADISGLDGLPRLKEVNISVTQVTAAPRGCPALERFIAMFARPLSDISGLDGLLQLKEVDISWTQVTAAPTGCPALEKFNAKFASRLANLSGLDGSLQLKEVDISNTDVKAAPRGCPALERFIASKANRLEDISGLDGSLQLKEVDITKTAVKAAPRGCPALERFIASEAIRLEDISGLDGSLQLKEVDISLTDVTAAPRGCPALERFIARLATHLEDISGLDGSLQLKEVEISQTAVTAAPRGCPALERFIARLATHLEDISGLDGLPQLKEVDITFTSVRAAPRGCPALKCFLASTADQLSDLSGLFDSPALQGISLPDRWNDNIGLPLTSLRRLTDMGPLFSLRRSLLDPSISLDDLKSQFRSLPESTQNRLKRGFWFYSGMPEGDPDFGGHLFERDPRAHAILRSIESLAARGKPFFSPEVREAFINLATNMESAETPEAKRAVIESLDPESLRILKHAIWRVRGVGSSDPDFAGHLIQRNPNDPIILEIAQKIQTQIAGLISE